MHSATTIYMGSTKSNHKGVGQYAADPATFPAGTVCHLKSDGTISLASADGSKVGVSLGISQSGHKRIPVAFEGKQIPVLLANGFTPTVGAQVQISTTTGKAVASGTAVNAWYETSTLTAIGEDGVAIADGAAYISMPGGL